MKRVATTALASVLVLCASAPAEAGKTRKKPTSPGMTSVSWNEGQQRAGASGFIDAVERCEENRVVRAFAIRGGSAEPLDVTVSGDQGSWNAEAFSSPKPDAIKVKVERKRVGNTVCKRGAQTESLDF